MIKVTYYWTQTASRVTGWSENFWGTGEGITDSVKSQAVTLLGKLYFLKGHQTVSLGHRISVWNANGTPTRESLLVSPELVPTSNPNSSSSYSSDYPTVAYLLQATGGTPVRSTRQWVRGIIDDSVIDGGRFNPFSLAAARSGLENYLATGMWGLRSRVQAGNPKRIIEDYENTTETFLTVGAHGFVIGDRVSLSGLKTSPQLARSPNGIYTISAVPAVNEFQLAGFGLDAGITMIPSKISKVQKIEFGVFTSTWKFLRVTSRQAGRPFGSPSGRPKKVRS